MVQMFVTPWNACAAIAICVGAILALQGSPAGRIVVLAALGAMMFGDAVLFCRVNLPNSIVDGADSLSQRRRCIRLLVDSQRLRLFRTCPGPGLHLLRRLVSPGVDCCIRSC